MVLGQLRQVLLSVVLREEPQPQVAPCSPSVTQNNSAPGLLDDLIGVVHSGRLSECLYSQTRLLNGRVGRLWPP